jgi:hypothetical protein
MEVLVDVLNITIINPCQSLLMSVVVTSGIVLSYQRDSNPMFEVKSECPTGAVSVRGSTRSSSISQTCWYQQEEREHGEIPSQPGMADGFLYQPDTERSWWRSAPSDTAPSSDTLQNVHHLVS